MRNTGGTGATPARPLAKRWALRPPPPPGLSEAWGLPALQCQLLHNRGVASAGEAWAFLAGDTALCHDPFLLPDVERAVDRILRALLFEEAVAVYGDYDVDGLTATALMVQALEALGLHGKVIPYVPHRQEEGYGLHCAALRSLRERSVQLVVTVDCGSGALDELAYARRLGLDVVVTDHHRVERLAPTALAEVNPKRPDSAYPFPALAGVSVAFKLVQALAAAAGGSERLQVDRWLDLVALGTVADMAPLVGENRYLVQRGLPVLNASTRPGLQELASAAGLRLGSLTCGHISFSLAPRLNAAGRLDDSLASLELLLTDDRRAARTLARLLEDHNAERQRRQDAALALAREQAQAQADDFFLVLWDAAYPVGVAGLVAGKLVEEFGRPALVLEMGATESRGSARSISGFDVTAALSQCQDLLLRYGGHAQAAGLTLPNANLALLRGRLAALAAAALAGQDLCPVLAIDAELTLADLPRAKPIVDQMAPFGIGNPAPTFLTRAVPVQSYQVLKDKHLRLNLRDERGLYWEAIGFQLAPLASQLAGASMVDVVYRLESHEWGGQESLRLNLSDVRRAAD